MMKPLLFVTCLMSIVFVRCTEECIYKQDHQIPQEKWYYTDSLSYEWEAEDTTNRYDLVLEIEHTDEYKYQNLYTRIITQFPDGSRVEDITNFDLASPAGKWLGDCRSGQCKAQAILQRNFLFRQTGQHRITVYQHMRHNPIAHLSAISLCLKPHSSAEH